MHAVLVLEAGIQVWFSLFLATVPFAGSAKISISQHNGDWLTVLTVKSLGNSSQCGWSVF